MFERIEFYAKKLEAFWCIIRKLYMSLKLMLNK